MTLQWHGDEAKEHVRRRAVRFLRRAAIVVERQAKVLLSVPGTGRNKGRKSGPITRSKPGEPPRKQTGRLRASVTREVDESSLTARVGTNVDYGKFLELGTSRGLKPRPWLRRALAEMSQRVNELLSGMGDSG